MLNNTQSSSKPRLKNDTLGNDALKDLYDAYRNMDFAPFQHYAKNVISQGSGKEARKQEIINSMDSPTISKAGILKKAQDFILAGMGLGV